MLTRAIQNCVQHKLCNENPFPSMATAVTTSRKSSLALVYNNGTFFFLSVLC